MSGRNELCKPKYLVDDNAEIYHEASSHWLKEVLEILFYFFKIQESMTQRNIEKKTSWDGVYFNAWASFKIKEDLWIGQGWCLKKNG